VAPGNPAKSRYQNSIKATWSSTVENIMSEAVNTTDTSIANDENSKAVKSGRWRRARWWIVGVSLVAMAGVGAAVVSSKKPNPEDDKKQETPIEFASNELVHLESRPLGQSLYVTGTLEAVQRATLRAKVSAEIRAMPVREGDHVSVGQVVAQIDTDDLEARLAERKGSLESARANLSQAQRNRDTNRDLLAKGFISQNAYDTIEATYQANVGQMQAAEAATTQMRNALRDARVVTPLAGIVSKRHVQPGDKVSIDSPLLSIVDLRKMELQAMVPADEIPRIKIGAKATLNIDGFEQRKFVGVVERISPATEPGTRAVLVILTLANPDEALRAGMFATGNIGIERSTAVQTLPSDAVQAAGNEQFVWTIANNALAKKTVKVGRRDTDAARVEVLTGLKPEDVVLAARFDNLREGKPALAKIEAAAPAKTPATAAGAVAAR
jgi:RND family efflux transporter MFP subunit